MLAVCSFVGESAVAAWWQSSIFSQMWKYLQIRVERLKIWGKTKLIISLLGSKFDYIYSQPLLLQISHSPIYTQQQLELSPFWFISSHFSKKNSQQLPISSLVRFLSSSYNLSVEMALVSSEAVVSFEEVVKRDNKDNIIDTKKVKVSKRVYPCRPQVNERKSWAKFGDVAGVARGTHKKGDFTLNQHPVIFETDDGNVEEELDMVKQIKNISKESMMMKQLRAGK